MEEGTEPQPYGNEAKLSHYPDHIADENSMNRWNGALSLCRQGDLPAVDALIDILGD